MKMPGEPRCMPNEAVIVWQEKEFESSEVFSEFRLHSLETPSLCSARG